MNQAAGFHLIPTPLRPPGRGPALGWTISLLAHALAVAWIWHAWPARPPDTDTGPLKQFEVRLIPLVRETPQPRPKPAPAPVAATRVRPDRPIPARAARTPSPAPEPPAGSSSASAPAPDAPSNPAAPQAPADVAGDASSATDTPTVDLTVDLTSARAAARLIARENRKGLVALPERKTVVDPNADRHVVDPIEASRRIDCQTARSQSKNLLGNIIMLAVDLTKNAIDDSGCKWR
jgi:hypothetical protein